VDTVWRTTKDDADDRVISNRKLVVGQDFAKRVQLSHTATDKLSGLRAKVKDDDFLLHVVFIIEFL
jgi:hypothetical protein